MRHEAREDEMTKLTDMGTTGLIEYAATRQPGRRAAIARTTCSRILRRRYGSDEAVIRFRRAVSQALDRRSA